MLASVNFKTKQETKETKSEKNGNYATRMTQARIERTSYPYIAGGSKDMGRRTTGH
jgi:hypothetical protein